MDIKAALVNATSEILPMFGLLSTFQGSIEEAQLASASQVNVLIGLSGNLRGSIVIGLKKVTALNIVSAMMGGARIDNLDSIAKSAIGEAANMIVGTAMANLQFETPVKFSPPTIVSGERIFLLISRVKSEKISFKLDADMFNISFSME